MNSPPQLFIEAEQTQGNKTKGDVVDGDCWSASPGTQCCPLLHIWKNSCIRTCSDSHVYELLSLINQIGGAAWLAPPRSYRSTSAFEAIRANLAIPLGMALKTRSKWGCEASNLLCSAIRNNATIEGTWIFGGWRLCP